MPTQNHKEMCCCCYETHYEQNNVLLCAHPLCSMCYRQLPIKICCICRSREEIPYISIPFGPHKEKRIRETQFTHYVLYSSRYGKLLTRHLKQRRTLEVLKKATKYLGEDTFIIHKNEMIVLGNFSIPKLFIFLMDNTFSLHNKEILKTYLMV